MELTGEYKGYTIGFNAYSDKFFAEVGDTTISAPTYKALTTKIDGIEKKGFVRTKCILPYWSGRGDEFLKCEVTSHIDNEYVWIVDQDGKRSKRSAKNIYIDNEDTAEKIKQTTALGVQISTLRKQIKGIEATIERYKI